MRTVSVRNFYPRSPCGERPVAAHVGRRKLKFLSTLSLRRATSEVSESEPLAEDFYPRSPCGERLLLAISIFIHAYFYPRSPCGERPKGWDRLCKTKAYFYPRSPCGERRVRARAAEGQRPISIHALLAESDSEVSESEPLAEDFYPRSPCGERQAGKGQCRLIFIFLSTLSLRRATRSVAHVALCGYISIHALLAESDRGTAPKRTGAYAFLSTLSLRRATDLDSSTTLKLTFLSTLSLRRATELNSS